MTVQRSSGKGQGRKIIARDGKPMRFTYGSVPIRKPDKYEVIITDSYSALSGGIRNALSKWAQGDNVSYAERIVGEGIDFLKEGRRPLRMRGSRTKHP